MPPTPEFVPMPPEFTPTPTPATTDRYTSPTGETDFFVIAGRWRSLTDFFLFFFVLLFFLI